VTVAVVTGATRGIGRAIATGLVEAGHHVVMTGRSAESIERVVAELRDGGGAVDGVVVDVTNDESVARLAAHVATIGTLGILVNNAGVYLEAPHVEGSAPNAILDQSIDVFRETMETNLYGPIRVIQALWPLMSSGGSIINLSSGNGQLQGMAGGDGAYSVSKTALNAATVKFANELRPHRISVNAMCPGWVHTDMGGPDGDRTVEEGADTALWLAALEPLDLTGGFFTDRKRIPW
jgi:NAD(P)-dependent dehydrogenase (short-subunit alcohol dehydrogenase family)